MYKIIQKDIVIDVVKDPFFVAFLPTGHIAFTDKSTAEGIVSSDGIVYSFTPHEHFDGQVASIEKISLEEFNRLQSLLNSDLEVYTNTTALDEAKQTTIKRLSNICNNKIVSGFSITLSDGNKYHFKLTTEDQLNLMMIENQLLAGKQSFIYHATEQPCRPFMRNDMNKIVEAFKKHIQYHTTYFNVVKHYIKSLTDLKEIELFTYGTDISDTVEDLALQQILKTGGVQK
jgi:hypothetical protein